MDEATKDSIAASNASEASKTPLAQNQILNPDPLKPAGIEAAATRTETVSPVTDRTITEDLGLVAGDTQENRPELTTGSPASERLRAFEDAEFGEDAVRINGRIERGHGSKFRDMAEKNPAKGREYAALERLVETELMVADAEGKLAQAKADHDEADKAVEAAHDEAGKDGE